MHAQSTEPAAPLSLEGRMRLALNRLVAASSDANEASIQFAMGHGNRLDENYDFTASINGTHYGFGSTPDKAVDESLKKFGTEESRRAARLARLKMEASALGCAVITPEAAIQAD